MQDLFYFRYYFHNIIISYIAHMKELAIQALKNIKGGLKTTIAGIVLFIVSSLFTYYIIHKEVIEIEMIGLICFLYSASIILFAARK